MIRVLHVLGHAPTGGVGAFLTNTLEYIDKNKFQFDFVMFNSDRKSNFISKVKYLGGNAHCFDSYLKLNDIFHIKKEFEEYLDNNEKYDIIHLHSPNLGIFILPIAKKKGIKTRILHSHSVKHSDNTLKSLRNYIIELPNKYYVTQRLACSEDAGKFLFKNNRFDIIHNGIDVNKYKYDYKIRKEMRRQSEDKIIIGHIGNFVPTKNHSYLLDIFKELYNSNNKYELWLIGDGELKSQIIDKINKLGISNAVKVLGYRNDVNKLMQAFDVFIFPSLFEGLGIVLIEAQVSGLSCFVSETIPKESNISDKIFYLDITEPPSVWKDKIIKHEIVDRVDYSKKIKNLGYDICDTTKQLQKFYEINMKRSI